MHILKSFQPMQGSPKPPRPHQKQLREFQIHRKGGLKRRPFFYLALKNHPGPPQGVGNGEER